MLLRGISGPAGWARRGARCVTSRVGPTGGIGGRGNAPPRYTPAQPPPPPREDRFRLDLRAVHVARGIDITSLFTKLYSDRARVSHVLQRDSIVLRLAGLQTAAAGGSGFGAVLPRLGVEPPEERARAAAQGAGGGEVWSGAGAAGAVGAGGSSAEGGAAAASSAAAAAAAAPAALVDDPLVAAAASDEEEKLQMTRFARPMDKYVVFYDYGACVFFNCDERLIATLLRKLQGHAAGIFAEGAQTTEEYMLLTDPACKSWSEVRGNSITVQQLDIKNVQVIAGVLGQTVALEFYEAQVAAVLEEFRELNDSVERESHEMSSGRFYSHLKSALNPREENKKRRLFQLVARNNKIYSELLIRLRLLDRKRPGIDEAEWKHEHYRDMWEELREEFELQLRFDSLNFKLDMIHDNAKFFLEVLATRRGEWLEWLIIVLIGAEIVLSVYDITH